MERAGRSDLQYLADISLETMFSGNFSASVAEVLATSTDIVRTEQYMDFITNRRFRSTLLCHKGRILKRNMQADVLKEGWLVSSFKYPEGFSDYDLSKRDSLQFTSQSGMILTTADPVALALLQVQLENGNAPMRVKDLAVATLEKLKKAKHVFGAGEEKNIETLVAMLALRYIFMGANHFYAEPMQYALSVSKKPQLSKLLRYQAANQDWVTGPKMQCVNIELFDKFFMKYIDGTNDAKALADLLMPHFKSKELFMNDSGVPLEDMNVVKERLAPVVEGTLKRYVELGLLEK